MSDGKPIISVKPLPPGYVVTAESITVGRGWFDENGVWQEEFETTTFSDNEALDERNKQT